MRICPTCLTEYPADEAFCINDGARTEEPRNTPSPRAIALTRRTPEPAVAPTVMLGRASVTVPAPTQIVAKPAPTPAQGLPPAPRTPAPILLTPAQGAPAAPRTPAPIALTKRSQPGAEPSAVADDLIGTMVGSYRVKSKLGEGGMGGVYLGEHPGIGSKVAIKVLHKQFNSDAAVVDRFFAEARAANLIGHDNIVKIIDFNQLPDGRHYFVMEFLEGKPLAALLPQCPLPLSVIGPILLQVCDALQAAHDKGIVHRDLKPDNIFLVTRNRRKHFVKVVDFGVAKLGSLSGNVHKTATGIVLGTPTYMAPEQAQGQSPLVGPRSDVYAVGCMMYQLATGRLPFEGSNFVELAIQHIQKPPPPPREVHPGVSEKLEAVILKALRKRPDERQQSMAELSAEIAECMKAEGVAFELPPADEEDNFAAVPRIATPGQRSLNVAASVAPRTPPPVGFDEVEPTVQMERGNDLRAAAAKARARTARRVGERDEIDREIREVALKKGGAGKWIAVAAVLAVGGGAGWYFTLGPGKTALKPAAAVAQEPLPPPPQPVEVTLSVVTVPLGAKYRATWEGGTQEGQTPAQLKLKEGTAVAFTFEKEGFKPAAASAVAKAAELVTVELAPEPPKKAEPAARPVRQEDKEAQPPKNKKRKERLGNEPVDVEL